jgi:hypothetical protein
MKRIGFIAISLLLIFSCQPPKEESKTENKKALPSDLTRVMDAHGGLDQWSEMKSMTYEIKRGEQNEVQKIDLYTRKERINAASFTTGYDGEKVWLKADTSYQGNAVFYHNLMFYFIAMPYVLADDGIVYGDVAPLEFDGQSYPGIRISYADSIGYSPEDEYYLHYNPETYQMEWLGYTVTYFSKEKSKDVHWIRYNNWEAVNGLQLPSSMDWYKYENGLPTEFRNTLIIENMDVSEEALDPSIFEIISGAEFLE